MTLFFNLFLSYFRALFGLLDGVEFEFFGYNVSFLSVLVSFAFIAIIASVFWRSGKA